MPAYCKGEKEGYKHLNAEFQRIARKDKKAFLSDQCKEIEKKKQNEKDGFLNYFYFNPEHLHKAKEKRKDIAI